MSPRVGLVAGSLCLAACAGSLCLAACAGETRADASVDAAPELGGDLGEDLGPDAGDPLAGCVVECVQLRPGEFRTECHASPGATCDAMAYPLCDRDAAPPALRDGGVFFAPMCVRPGVSGEVDRVPACATDALGTATLTGAPVVTCVTSN